MNLLNSAVLYWSVFRGQGKNERSQVTVHCHMGRSQGWQGVNHDFSYLVIVDIHLLQIHIYYCEANH